MSDSKAKKDVTQTEGYKQMVLAAYDAATEMDERERRRAFRDRKAEVEQAAKRRL